MPGKKSTHAEVTRRVKTVAKLIARGYSRQDILEYVDEKTDWGVSDGMVDEYTRRAREMLREQAEEEVADALARHLAMRREMYQQALGSGDMTNARQVATDEAKLLSLYKPDKLQIEGNLSVESDSLSDAIASLSRAAAAPNGCDDCDEDCSCE